jgi:hypothetical protein
VSWQHQWRPELKEEGFARASFELEEIEGVVRLTVTQVMDRKDSMLIEGASNGYPPVMASLKSFLETGEPFSAPKIEALISRALEDDPKWA